MPIDYRKDGKVAVFTINRPEVLNALSLDALTDLSAELRNFLEDPEVRVGIITGAGDKAFCSGMDLKSTAGLPIESLFGQGTLVRGLDVWKPMIAAVNGYAFGGVLRLHLHATYDSREIMPVSVSPRSQWDSCPAGGGTQRLPRLLPFGKAFEMVLMGKRISAEEAFRLNLVSSVVHAAELMPTAREWATRISEFDPKAVQSVKKALLEGSSMRLNDGLSYESKLLSRLIEHGVQG